MIKFGTGGWRAVIGQDFIRANIQRLAQGLCNMASAEGKTDKPIIIGYDRRFLSSDASVWISEVLTGNNIKVLLTNRSTPTPLIMHTVKSNRLHYGLEITASHNSSNYNGIKLIVHEGRDASQEETQILEKFVAEVKDDDIKHCDYDEACATQNIIILKNPFNAYIDEIIDQLDMEKIKKRGLRILFDTMHGSGTYPVMVILCTARCTLDLMNYNKDAYFGGIMPAPSEKSLAELSLRVVREGYDLGIALDGDGDRLGIIDCNGKFISANEILVMLYYYLHEYKKWNGAVVRNLATTHMLDKIAESFGEKCYEVPVGFKYVSAKLEETDAVLGGESSGGLTVRGHIFGKDSVYAASLFIEMVCAIDKSPTVLMNELRKKYGTYVMVEDNLKFSPELKDEIIDIIMIKKLLPSFGKVIKRVNYDDGCKVYFDDDSFVICRFSGTEPLLRIFAEASASDIAYNYIECYKRFLKL